MKTTKIFATLVSCLTLCGTAAIAQNQNEPKQGTAARISDSKGQDASLNQFLADCLIQANKKEAALAEIAMARASHQGIRDFARKLVQDHKRMIADLEQAVGRSPADLTPGQSPGNTRGAPEGTGRKDSGSANEQNRDRRPTPGSPDSSNRSDDEPRSQDAQDKGRPGEAVGPANRDSLPPALAKMKSIGDELHEQCLATARRELTQKSGPELDKCFLGMQIGAHLQAVDMLTVFKKHSSGKLAEVLDSSLPTVQAHLEHARSLLQVVDKPAETNIAPSSAREPKQVK